MERSGGRGGGGDGGIVEEGGEAGRRGRNSFHLHFLAPYPVLFLFPPTPTGWLAGRLAGWPPTGQQASRHQSVGLLVNQSMHTITPPKRNAHTQYSTVQPRKYRGADIATPARCPRFPESPSPNLPRSSSSSSSRSGCSVRETSIFSGRLSLSPSIRMYGSRGIEGWKDCHLDTTRRMPGTGADPWTPTLDAPHLTRAVNSIASAGTVEIPGVCSSAPRSASGETAFLASLQQPSESPRPRPIYIYGCPIVCTTALSVADSHPNSPHQSTLGGNEK